jgi:transposase InsO family protein
MGKVACAYDNSLIESFFGSMQIELLDRRSWTTRAELANAIFERMEAFYNPVRMHSALDCLSPSTTRPFTPPPRTRHDHHTPTVRNLQDGSHTPADRLAQLLTADEVLDRGEGARRIAWRVMIPKKISTMFSQQPEVGVKCKGH